jgi:hypothetical protein
MQLKNFFFSLGTPFIVLSSLATVNVSQANTILSSDKEPELQKLGSDLKFATGSVIASIDGKEDKFMTTSERIEISEERIKAADPRAQSMLRSMNGKVVDTVVLRLIGSTIYVTIDAYGNIQENGPAMNGDGARSLKISFALTPDTLSLQEKNREIAYSAPGQSTTDASVGKDFELKIESITKLPKGALALKGSFSGSLTQDRMGKDLSKPITVEGTFDIYRANSNDAVLKLLKEKL